jgi:hypothetical protein
MSTKWGERGVEWVDLPEADLSIIDGSVMSRPRVFSDVCTNTAMEAKDRIMRERQQRTRKFPRDVRVSQRPKPSVPAYEMRCTDYLSWHEMA